ncbi:MAG: Rps23 Pro-64 3,4-dihydroxylase Tpa1-like proline 4-hydroxylase [Planctomycetota bacterium]|jgi:Rps23 Pro-64 3,4-dihydroxylase Tpa1-like proline 4-hydroxylase
MAEPFPFVCIDHFLDESFATEIARSFPSFDDAQGQGRMFESVNEHLKVQVTDHDQFPRPIAELNRLLASAEFLEQLEAITGVRPLLADASLAGGGIHQTGPRGRLDVHVDFNQLETTGWHRRLNILVYFNSDWKEDWGGELELWDSKVKKLHHSFQPIHNRCVVFETNEMSFHGVEKVTCPTGKTRNSFAGYYYTAEAPDGWDGTSHNTIFKARPSEPIKKIVLMPMDRVNRAAKDYYQKLKNAAKSALGR